MVIEECGLFRGMSPEFMVAVRRHLFEVRYDAGALLYAQGGPADYLYILAEGRVRVVLSDHGQMTLVVSKPGDVIG